MSSYSAPAQLIFCESFPSARPKFVEDTILYAGIAQGLIELPGDVQLDFDLYALLYRMSENYPAEWIVWLMNRPEIPGIKWQETGEG